MQDLLLVNVPFANLRREPKENRSPAYAMKDALQETQLLFGERLFLLEDKGEWLYVEALEQQKYSLQKQWHSYPGWVKKTQVIQVKTFPECDFITKHLWSDLYSSPNTQHSSHTRLSLGTHLKGVHVREDWLQVELPNEQSGFLSLNCVQSFNQIKNLSTKDLRNSLVNLGKQLVDVPYFWGGRCAYSRYWEGSGIASVDCSGLINLLYRAHGISIPRDAHDQFLRCSQRCQSNELERGDLLFLGNIESPMRIHHVMLYIGQELFLEAALDPGKVRIVSLEEKLGCHFCEISDGIIIDKNRIFLGSYLNPCKS